MSLETLLEAAKYLEYRSEAKARGEEPYDYYTFAKLCAVGSDISKIHPKPATKHQLTPNSSQPTEESKERRRASTPLTRESVLSSSQEQSGTGTREVHNKLEKNRRAHLKECFETLKKQLPNMDDRKTSNLSILRGALRHIQVLKRKEREHEHDMERLAREKIAFQQRLASLKKDLSTQLDHIDVGVLIPDGDNETTTTASECGVLSDFDDDMPREVSSTSNHNSTLASDMTSSSSSSTVGSVVHTSFPSAVTAVGTSASSTLTSAPARPISGTALLAAAIDSQASTLPPDGTTLPSDSPLSVSGKASVSISATVATQNSPSGSLENSVTQGARVVSASSLHAMAGILTTPHTVQVITQPSGIKVITAPNSISASPSVQHLPMGHHPQGPIHVLTPATTSYVSAASNVTVTTSKSLATESLVQVASSSAINSSKQQLVSPVTLVSPQTLVGITQVATVTKPIIINQTSALSELITSSVTSSPLTISQGLVKQTPASSILTSSITPTPVALAMKNAVQNSIAPVTPSSASQSNMVATLHVTKSHPQIIQPSSTAQTVSSLIPTGVSQMNNVGRHVVAAAVKPISASTTARSSLPHIAGVAHVTHVMSQSPVAAPVGQLVSPGSHVSAVTPLVGSVSVVSHAAAVHHPQILTQPQPLGKVLASPILKSVNQINQIPIIQQQFLQQAVGSASAQPVVKPVVVVSMPNIVPSSNVASLPPASVASANDQQGTVRGPGPGSQQ